MCKGWRICTKMNAKFIIARNIRCRRQSLQMTQIELAKRVFVSRSTLVSLEKGRRSVAADELCNFAKALGVQSQDFLVPGKFYRD
jgi:transcriptional regulator with XRE-family HTH domain